MPKKPTIIKSPKKARSAITGRFTVEPTAKSARGEGWAIKDKKGRATVVVTTQSSASVLDQITVKHRKVLRRLADK